MLRSDKLSLCEVIPKQKIEVSVQDATGQEEMLKSAHIILKILTFALDVNMNLLTFTLR